MYGNDRTIVRLIKVRTTERYIADVYLILDPSTGGGYLYWNPISTYYIFST